MERHRKITPTDVDGLIDYSGNSFVYIEGKLVGANMVYGQRLAIENIIESHTAAGNPSVAFIFRHNVPAEEVIIAKDKIVYEVYRMKDDKFKWQSISDKKLTLLECVEAWEKHCKEIGVKI